MTRKDDKEVKVGKYREVVEVIGDGVTKVTRNEKSITLSRRGAPEPKPGPSGRA